MSEAVREGIKAAVSDIFLDLAMGVLLAFLFYVIILVIFYGLREVFSEFNRPERERREAEAKAAEKFEQFKLDENSYMVVRLVREKYGDSYEPFMERLKQERLEREEAHGHAATHAITASSQPRSPDG